MFISFLTAGDSTGVLLHYTSVPPLWHVGMLGLHVQGTLPAQSTVTWDSACRMRSIKDDIKPFAFLTHTHSKGVWASGWVVRNMGDPQEEHWEEIGSRDPQVRIVTNYNLRT